MSLSWTGLGYRTSVLGLLRVFWRYHLSTLRKVLRSPVLAVLRLFPAVLGMEDIFKLCVDFAQAKKVRKPPCYTLLELINKRI